jgi:XTP/dITP diphosphohydrolase/tetrapyrrole methylase family protein/MazG family protein/ATP diphosphatase
VSDPDESGRALARLDAISRRLRVECPWDREQDERSIVPHTVEEAYELADAANRGDDAKLLDELGDVLFQVVFLSILLEERGRGDFAAVAEHCRQKLIRRHPHVFGDTSAETAGEVLANWDEIKRGEEGREPGIFGEVPENLPGPLYARKLLRRATSAGVEPSLPSVAERAHASDFDSIGELLFAAVALAREHGVDPELALRSAADRFRNEIEEQESPARE